MRHKLLLVTSALAAAVATSLVLMNCGGGNDQAATAPPPAATPTGAQSPTAAPLGGFKVGCGKPQQQQQQMQFQQQQQPGCVPQFEFFEAKISDFDVRFDCDDRIVSITDLGTDQKTGKFPIQQDGTVKGQLQYQQQVQSDGHGNISCWVRTVIDFDGHADCRYHTIDMNSQATFLESTVQEVPPNFARDAVESPLPSSSPVETNSPETSPLPSVEPTPTPSIASSPSASPSPSCAPLPVVPASSSGVTLPIAKDPCTPFGGTTPMIPSGTKVTWINNDSAAHEVVSDEGLWDSGAIPPGQSFTTTAQGSGTQTYHLQDEPNLRGELVVTAGASPSPGTSPTASPTHSLSPSPTTSPRPSPFPSPTYPPLPPPKPPKPIPVNQTIVCVVKNPCPVFGQGKLSCP